MHIYLGATWFSVGKSIANGAKSISKCNKFTEVHVNNFSVWISDFFLNQ